MTAAVHHQFKNLVGVSPHFLNTGGKDFASTPLRGLSWRRVSQGVARPFLATGRHFLEHFDTMGDGADDEAETFDRAAWFAGQADH